MSPDAQPFIQIHLHMKGCAPGLVLKQRQETCTIRKWPIQLSRDRAIYFVAFNSME